MSGHKKYTTGNPFEVVRTEMGKGENYGAKNKQQKKAQKPLTSSKPINSVTNYNPKYEKPVLGESIFTNPGPSSTVFQKAASTRGRIAEHKAATTYATQILDEPVKSQPFHREETTLGKGFSRDPSSFQFIHEFEELKSPLKKQRTHPASSNPITAMMPNLRAPPKIDIMDFKTSTLKMPKTKHPRQPELRAPPGSPPRKIMKPNPPNPTNPPNPPPQPAIPIVTKNTIEFPKEQDTFQNPIMDNTPEVPRPSTPKERAKKVSIITTQPSTSNLTDVPVFSKQGGNNSFDKTPPIKVENLATEGNSGKKRKGKRSLDKNYDNTIHNISNIKTENVEEAQHQLNREQAALIQNEHEVEHLKESLSHMKETSHPEHQEKVQGLEKHIKNLESKQKAAEEAYTKKLGELEMKNKGISNELNRTKTEKEILEKTKKVKAGAHTTEIETKLSIANSRANRLQDTLDNTQKDLIASKQKIIGEHSLNQQITNLTAQNNTLQSKTITLAQEKAAAASKAESAQTELEKLRTENKNLAAKKIEYEGKLKDTDPNTSAAEVTRMRNKLNSLESELKSSKQKEQELSSTLGGAKASLELHKAEETKLKNEKAQLFKELETARGAAQKKNITDQQKKLYTDEIDKLRNALSGAETKYRDAMGKAASIEPTKTQLDNAIARENKLQSELLAAKAELASKGPLSAAEMSRTKEHIENLDKKIFEQQQEITKYKNDYTIAEDERKSQLKQFTEYKTNNAQKEEEIRQAKQKLDAINELTKLTTSGEPLVKSKVRAANAKLPSDNPLKKVIDVALDAPTLKEALQNPEVLKILAGAAGGIGTLAITSIGGLITALISVAKRKQEHESLLMREQELAKLRFEAEQKKKEEQEKGKEKRETEKEKKKKEKELMI